GAHVLILDRDDRREAVDGLLVERDGVRQERLLERLELEHGRRRAGDQELAAGLAAGVADERATDLAQVAGVLLVGLRRDADARAVATGHALAQAPTTVAAVVIVDAADDDQLVAAQHPVLAEVGAVVDQAGAAGAGAPLPVTGAGRPARTVSLDAAGARRRVVDRAFPLE